MAGKAVAIIYLTERMSGEDRERMKRKYTEKRLKVKRLIVGSNEMVKRKLLGFQMVTLHAILKASEIRLEGCREREWNLE